VRYHLERAWIGLAALVVTAVSVLGNAPAPSPPCLHTGTTPTAQPQTQAIIDQLHIRYPFRALVLPGPQGVQFGIRVDGEPGAQIELHPNRAHLTLEDNAGHTVAGGERFRFDSCITSPYGPYPQPPLPRSWSGFILDPTRLVAGMYRIAATYDAGFVTRENGQALVMDQRYGYNRLAVYVPPAPDRKPELVQGQQFIALPAFRSGLRAAPFIDTSGVHIQAGSVLGRIVTLEQINRESMQFHVEGIDASLYLARAADALSIPGLYPLIDDNSVRQLRVKYLGRQVWAYGGLYVYGANSGGPTGDALKITGLYRARGYAPELAIGSPGSWAASALDRVSGFVALDPIVIRFQTPAALTMQGWFVQSVPDTAVLYWVLSDAWDFERSFSLVPISRAHPDWSRATIDAIESRHVEIGMSKDMIAWMFGYPSVYGTIGQVQKLDMWRYDEVAPFRYTVFFRKGTVVKYDAPGRLP